MLIDPQFRNFLSAPGSNPTQASLTESLREANRITVSARGFNFESVLGVETLLEGRDSAAIEELRCALVINENGPFGHCMCMGDLGIEFWFGENLLLNIGLHHGVSIRCSLWKWYAHLRDGQRVLEWLAARGIEHPKQRHLDDMKMAQRSQDQWQVWLQAAPPALAAHPKLLAGDMAAFDWEALEKLVETAWPNPRERVIGLFEWYGSGSGPWSGYPSYEGVPDHFLMVLDKSGDRVGNKSVLLHVLETESGALSARGWLGAARYFARWERKRKRCKPLSPDLRQRLLDTVREFVPSAYATDILACAERTFGSQT